MTDHVARRVTLATNSILGIRAPEAVVKASHRSESVAGSPSPAGARPGGRFAHFARAQLHQIRPAVRSAAASQKPGVADEAKTALAAADEVLATRAKFSGWHR